MLKYLSSWSWGELFMGGVTVGSILLIIVAFCLMAEGYKVQFELGEHKRP